MSQTAARGGDKPVAAMHDLLLLEWDGTSMRLIRTTSVASALPKRRGSLSRAWQFQVVDRAGAVIYTGELDDPTHVGALFEDGTTVEATRPGASAFAIRIPHATSTLANPTRVEFRRFSAAERAPFASLALTPQER